MMWAFRHVPHISTGTDTDIGTDNDNDNDSDSATAARRPGRVDARHEAVAGNS
jgi:hypothetical protein